MSRQAFEAWVRTVDKSLSLHKVPDGGYKYTRTKSAWSAYKAATDAALERAAEVCDGINADYTARYVAAGAKMPNNLDFLDGASDGAEECAEAIRALKDEK